MSKQAKKGLVPKLRFPEFANAGEWLALQLIDVTDKKVKWNFTGGPFGSNLLASDFVDAKQGVRVIQLQNIGDGTFLNDYKIFTSKDKADELISCNIFPGDIIISKMGDPVGRACLIPDIHPRYVMGSDGIRVVVNERSFDKYFVFSNINSVPFRSSVESKSTGSTRKRIGLDTLRELTFLAPKDLLEQQKVGACLSSLDTLLTAEREKLEALREHKKGLMQQLFPVQGAKVPALRFPGFKGDWMEKTMADLADITTGNKDTQNKVADGSYPFFVRSQTIERINSFSYDGEAILTAGDGVGVGKVFHYINGKFDFHQRVYCIYNFEKGVSGKFVFHFFSEHFDQRVMRMTAKNSVDSVRMPMISEMPVAIPVDPAEQDAVATCLSSLDERIALQDERVVFLEEHKKGLIQGLFPAAN